MKILILSSGIGGGHDSCAKSIYYKLREDNDVVIIDALKHLSKTFDKVLISAYLNTLAISKELYRAIYGGADSESSSKVLTKIAKSGAKKLKKLIESEKADVVITTNVIPTMILCSIKETLNIKLISVITDYGIHKTLVQEGVDLYIVGDESLVNQLESRGVEKGMILPIGIPFCSDFLNNHGRRVVKKELGLSEDTPLITLSGGSLGLGDIKDIYKRILKLRRKLSLVVITGKNEALFKKLSSIEKPVDNIEVIILGYTNSISKILGATDLFVTKPGGLSITEAMVKETPMALFSPIPGQEDDNLEYVINNGMGLLVSNPKRIGAVIDDYFDNPGRAIEMKACIKRKVKPNVLEDLEEAIYRLCNQERVQIEIDSMYFSGVSDTQESQYSTQDKY